MQNLVWMLKQDKLLHMLAGIVMADVFLLAFALFLPWAWSLAAAFALATIVMAGKELVWDKMMKRGVCNWKDFVAGEMAIVFQTLMFVILNLKDILI